MSEAMREPRKVLIIDDDSRNIFALKAVLTSRGYHCLTAPGAREGMKTLEADPRIGVVLLDMMMPDMDGYEAIDVIKQVRASVPVVAVTAQAMAGDREKCLQAGADGYISKPIDVEALLEILSHHLS